MKTSEFISKVESLGYQVNVCEFWIDVIDRFGVKGVVFTNGSNLALSTNNIDLVKICVEYAETPILERRDVKKYIAKIPDPENLSTERIYTLVRAFNGNIMISRPQTKRILENEAYHLTEEEIKRNHAYLWEFAEEVK